MRARLFTREWFRFFILLPCSCFAQEATPLAGTAPLTTPGDLSAQMVAGIDQYLMRAIEGSRVTRQKFWRRDFSAREAYEKSIQPNREHFRKMIGAVDARLPVKELEFIGGTVTPARIAETDRYTIHAVRWPVFAGVFGEGLLLQPKGPIQAQVIALPDADQTPEMLAGLAPGLPPVSQFARRLAESGCLVLVPALVSRDDAFSGNAALSRFTNLPHREWIYRQAFELGRHIIGYETQKILGAVDWFASTQSNAPAFKIGVIGYGEGGLLALYAGALDPRIDAIAVSGYFAPRERVWAEPVYRNVFGLLREFGDAEIASLIAPRQLLVEFSESPKIDGPPKARAGRSGAAAGVWSTPDFNAVEAEADGARSLVRLPGQSDWLRLINGSEGTAVSPGSRRTLAEFLAALGVPEKQLDQTTALPQDGRKDFQPAERQRRQVEELVQHTQALLRGSERRRDEFFWRQLKRGTTNVWGAAVKPFQEKLWNDVIGRLPASETPLRPRSRKIYDREKWTGYDVVLDVYPDVFAWGVLLLPKDLKPGERRPVVVCQHGLEGVPADTITDDPKSGGYGPYKAYAARLAERGFIVFAPHNPYRGVEKFRVLQRKAHPLGQSLFSVILAQHERILDWLAAQPFVDPARIGFYGLSYGGKTAMRVPALLERYCLSICSADFNEWVTKCATIDSPYSYLYTIEYDMYEFDLGHTFNYAEMAALIAPRPFMVERGHDDGVAPDEWVAHEYARVRRHYAKLGIPERTEIEFFNGPHTINGQGTFRFLHRHLNWPEPPAGAN